jgi:hypothetical protein
MTQNMYKISVMKPLEISPLWRCRRGLVDDIKIHLDEMRVAGGWDLHVHVVRCWDYSYNYSWTLEFRCQKVNSLVSVRSVLLTSSLIASGRCFVSEKYNKFSINLQFNIKNRLAVSGKWRPALGLLTIVNDSPAITSGLRFKKDNKVFHNTRVKIINTIWVFYHMVIIRHVC